MQKIDINNWKRKDHFKMFTSYSNPYYGIGFNLDVTDLKSYADNNNVSFYKTMIYCITEAINKTEEFLYTYKNGDIYKIDRRQASYTYFVKENDTFRFIYAETHKGFKNFVEKAVATENEQEVFMDITKETDELIHITCLPWLDMTSFSNARDLSNKYESVPKFAWGKYKIENGRCILNMSLEVNHAFIDGFHVEKLINNFNEVVKSLGE